MMNMTGIRLKPLQTKLLAWPKDYPLISNIDPSFFNNSQTKTLVNNFAQGKNPGQFGQYFDLNAGGQILRLKETTSPEQIRRYCDTIMAKLQMNRATPGELQLLTNIRNHYTEQVNKERSNSIEFLKSPLARELHQGVNAGILKAVNPYFPSERVGQLVESVSKVTKKWPAPEGAGNNLDLNS